MPEEYHGPSKRKKNRSGAPRKKLSDKKLSMVGGHFTATKVGEEVVSKTRRTRGGGTKNTLKKAVFANVVDSGKVKKAKIKTVLESPQNRHHARENIITKGTIIDTELGKARVTNRVGQDGVVHAVLVK